MRRFVVFNPSSREPLRIRAEGLQFSDDAAMLRWVNANEDVPERLVERLSGQTSAGWSFAPNTLEEQLAQWNVYALFVDGDEQDFLAKISDPRAHEEAAAEMTSHQVAADVDEVVKQMIGSESNE